MTIFRGFFRGFRCTGCNLIKDEEPILWSGIWIVCNSCEARLKEIAKKFNAALPKEIPKMDEQNVFRREPFTPLVKACVDYTLNYLRQQKGKKITEELLEGLYEELHEGLDNSVIDDEEEEL